MSDYNQIVMTGTVVQPAEWHDGVGGEQGYALFTVRNAISTKFLKDAKSLEYSVVCFGNSGSTVLPYLKKGQTVVFNGQEMDWRVGRVVVAPWVRVCGMDFNFEVEEIYRSAEEAQIPKKQDNVFSTLNKSNNEQVKHFKTFEEVLRAVGCKDVSKNGLKTWLKQYLSTLTGVAVKLYPNATRENARQRFCDKVVGIHAWLKGELDKVYDILVEIKSQQLSETDKIKSFLKVHGILQSSVAIRFYDANIKAGFYTLFVAEVVFSKNLVMNQFTSDELRRIMQIAQELVSAKSVSAKSKEPVTGSTANENSIPVLVELENENGEPVMMERSA